MLSVCLGRNALSSDPAPIPTLRDMAIPQVVLTLEFRMYMDEKAVAAHMENNDSWLDGDWMRKGIDNKLYKGGMVPFAFPSEDEAFALQKFAHASRAGKVRGPPEYLLMGSLPWAEALGYILADPPSIKILRDRPERTIAFYQPLDQVHYPGLEFDLVHVEGAREQQLLLQKGLAALKRKR